MTTLLLNLQSPLKFNRISRMLTLALMMLVGLTGSVSGSAGFHDSDLELFLCSDQNAELSNAALEISCPLSMTVACLAEVPAAPQDYAAFVDQGGSASSNCGLILSTFDLDEIITGSCALRIERVFSITDSCGITFSCTQAIQVLDDVTPPTLLCPSNITVACPADIPPADPGSVTALDECGNVQIKHIGDEMSDFMFDAGSCPATLTRTYQGVDDCGNAAECVQVITIEDDCDTTTICQLCEDSVPEFYVDLSDRADTAWISPNISRDGSCCEQTGNDCVHFTVILPEDAVGFIFNILSGSIPPGGEYFQLDCGERLPIGDLICVDGGENFELTYCAPDQGPNTYTITSFSAQSLPDENGNGVPDRCESCSDVIAKFDYCAAVYFGYSPLECADLGVSVTGGRPPYSYSWSTGETADSVTVCPTEETAYSVTVTDVNGCSSIATITVFATKVICPTDETLVEVCHYDPFTKIYTSLCLAEDEVSKHLEHGDALGACGANPCRGRNFEDPVYFGNNHVIFGGREGGQPRVSITPPGNGSLFPNPAISDVTVQYDLESDGTIVIQIYDVNGQLHAITSQTTSRGKYSTTFDLQDLPDGLYFVKINADERISIHRMIKSTY